MLGSRTTFLAVAGLSAGAALMPAAAEAGDFSGTQVGIHADYLWAKVSPSGFANAGDSPLAAISSDVGGGGISASHDWQMDNLVFGVFGSVTFGGPGGSTSQALTVRQFEGVTIEHHGFSTDLSYLASFGGRVGWVFSDAILLYGQFGATTADLSIIETGDRATAKLSDSRWGYVLGAGADVKLSDRWTVGFLWSYHDLDTEKFVPTGYGAGTIGFRASTSQINLKYRF